MRTVARWSTMLVGLITAACSGAPPPPPAVAQGAPDVDADEILDDVDECVTEKEDRLPPRPADGCKTDPNDLDDDGIAQSDRCPKEPENRNGYQDLDGCPDALPEVMVTREELRCEAQILFSKGKATIDDASAPLVENLATTLKSNPRIELVEIAGHADASGDDAVNVDLTKRRALSVVEALAAHGVERKRMRGAGYGAYCPLARGEDDAANEINRRVEFKILLQDGKETGVPLGCDAAAAKGIRPGPLAKPDASGARLQQ